MKLPKDTDTPMMKVMKFFVFLYQNLLELICLNLFFVLCCLPVVTIPLAVIALSDTLIAAYRETDSHLLRHYWRSILHPVGSQYLTMVPVVLLEVLLGLGALIYLSVQSAPPILWVGCGINAVAFLLSVALGLYSVPWMVTSGERYRAVWKHAFLLSLARLPQTVTCLAEIALVWIICIRWFRQCWIAFFLIVFSLSALIGVFCTDDLVRDILDTDTAQC